MKKFLLTICCVFLPVVTSLAETFQLVPEKEEDKVIFESSAKLEFIKGTTKNIRGFFNFDPSNPTDSIYGMFEVDLTTLKTGIDKRDEHMRDNHLKTDKYPTAYFELTSLINMPSEIASDSSYSVEATGWFYIHGLKREISPIVSFMYSDEIERKLFIKAEFDIDLDDYKIERPRALFLKLAERIEVTVQLTAISGKLLSTTNLPDWPEAD